MCNLLHAINCTCNHGLTNARVLLNGAYLHRIRTLAMHKFVIINWDDEGAWTATQRYELLVSRRSAMARANDVHCIKR